MSLLENIVISAAEEFGPDRVLIWAGCDAHCDDDEEDGGELEACALAVSVCTTMEALAGDQSPECVAPDS